MKNAHILLVEDNEGDILLTKEALEERSFVNKVSVVKNGHDALDFVFQKGQFSEVILPDLILLDINLPRKNGHEVLKSIKSNKKTRALPVIILTTSSFNSDIHKAYDLHANSYVTKPIEAESFLKAINIIEDYWLQLVQLPKTE